MLTYYVVDDPRTAGSQEGDAYTLLDRAIRAYRLPLSNCAKALKVCRDGETMDNTRWLEHYVPQDFTNYWQYLDYFAVSIKVPEQYQPVQNYIQPAITQASQLGSDRAKVEYLHDYLCGLMAYDLNAVTEIAQIFSPHDNELKGACGDYTRAFNYLCASANIPSFTVRSADHSWNMVYADGHWLNVDLSADDLRQNKNAMLVETYPRHTDIAPDATAFLKELLVPGSTK